MIKKFIIFVSILLIGFILTLPISAASETGLKIDEGEQFTYKIDFKNGSSSISNCRYTTIESEGQRYLHYTNGDNEGEQWDVTTDLKGFPKQIVYSVMQNTVKLKFDGIGGVAEYGTWNGQAICGVQKFTPNASLEINLVLRTLDLTNKNKYIINVIQKDKLPELVVYPMYFQVIQDETVKVEAGTFKCKKILFSLADWRGVFYKSYHYITNDAHHYWVKMENMPPGANAELIAINNSP